MTPPALGRRAVANTAFILAARTASKLVSLVVVVVLANALGADGYGRYTTLIAFSALVSVLADFGFNPLYTREAARNPERLGDFLGTLLILKVALSAVALVALGLALGLGAGLFDLALPGAALLITTAYANQLRDSFYAVGRVAFDAIAIACETAIQAGLILFGAHEHAGVAFFVWSYAASYAFTCVYCLVVINAFRIGRIRMRFDLALVKKWLPLALPFGLTFFLTNLYFRADVPILQHFRPFAEVGWYQFAYKPFEALQFIPLAIQAVVYPILGVYFVRDQGLLRAGYRRFFKVLVLLGWPLTVGTFMLAGPIASAFRMFPQSEASLRILAFAIVFLFVNSSFYAMLNATNRQHLNVWSTGIASVLNIGLNLLLIPKFGYLAASATTVGTEAALSGLGWWFVQRGHRELRLDWLRVSWKMLLAGAVMAAVLLPLSHSRVYIGLAVGAVVYVAALLALRVADAEEWRLLVGNRAFARLSRG
ncbi:MAG TPA: flippase [Candidatus Dormibacteraeota bacterium]|nr:flippase [Candidatus Dormibacteraeota bacterium]